MNKKLFLAALAVIMSCAFSQAQNLQFHYDFGSLAYKKGKKALNGTSALAERPTMTSTVEMFRPDKWGSTFFFVDMNYGTAGDKGGMLGAYWEIYRELQFWKFPIAIHIEYNGGLDVWTKSYDDAWLLGPSWSVASKDFKRTFSLSALYKVIPRNAKSIHNFQITAAWNISFCHDMFLFCGFVDFWQENRPWQISKHSGADGTDYIIVSEPQIWYNFNTIKGLDKFNFSLGAEVEISNNFVDAGFFAIPTVAAKWTF